MVKIKITQKIILVVLTSMLAWSIPVQARESRVNMGYIYFGNPGMYADYINKTQGSIQMISPSYFDIDDDGTLKITSKIDLRFINEMHKKGIKVIPFLSNHWDRNLGRMALKNRENLAEAIVKGIKDYNLDGVNVDLENLTEVDREDYADLVKRIKDKLPVGKSLSVAVAANPKRYKNGWHASYDYKSLGAISDYLVIMTYDESYQGSPQGPVASTGFVEAAVKHILESVPKEKILLGIPFYGRCWKEGESYGGYGIDLKKVEQLVEKYNGQVTFDPIAQSPKATITINPWNEKTNVYGKELTPGTYTIWYENEASIKQKLKLVQKYNLKGAANWSLGQELEYTWNYYKLWLNGQYFIDIPDHWAEEDILAMNEKGWMVGTSSTHFSPNIPLTRAQAATILVKALGMEEQEGKSTFKDVSDQHWAKKYIAIAQENKIIRGDGSGNFFPNSPVTREQMAAMLDKIIENQLENNFIKFKDLDPARWSYEVVTRVANKGIFTGYEDGTFRPKDNVTRAQMAALMNKLSNKYLNTN